MRKGGRSCIDKPQSHRALEQEVLRPFSLLHTLMGPCTNTLKDDRVIRYGSEVIRERIADYYGFCRSQKYRHKVNPFIFFLFLLAFLFVWLVYGDRVSL